MLGYNMATLKHSSLHHYENVNFLGNIFEKKVIIVVEANRLEPRSGPIYVGPDLGSSLFAILQKY